MSKSTYGVKSQLIAELLIIAFLFSSVLVNKYFHSNNVTAFAPITIWLLVWGGFIFYNNKHNDMRDESSKSILSKVNEITIKILLYSIGILAIFFSTPFTQHIVISNVYIGMILFAVIFTIAILRFSLFIYFDRKGIYN